jgi:multidrug transporter EmrE-like cation transporter
VLALGAVTGAVVFCLPDSFRHFSRSGVRFGISVLGIDLAVAMGWGRNDRGGGFVISENLMDMNPYALLLIAILFGVSGQLLLKLGMARQLAFRFVETIGLLRNWPVLMGFGCYGIATLLYFQVLARLDLSLAYPTVSLGYVLVIILCRIFFKETVSAMRWMAVMIICIGVVLVGLGSS